MPKNIPAQGSSAWWDKEWTTALYKEPVKGPVWVSYQGLQGDAQSDRRVHGGVDKAICVYPGEHYAFWKKRLDLPNLKPGAFGENFTTEGLFEEEVCIGDVYTIGEVTLQVSQPRQPCWKLSRRWRIKDLPKQVEETGKTGFYFRVLQHGHVEKKQTFERIDRPCPAWTLIRCNQIMHCQEKDPASVTALAQCSLLSGSWKDTLYARATRNHSQREKSD